MIIMKEKIFNYNKLNMTDITSQIIRVKALILNSRNEILLGEAFNTVQFPGGHLEENETLEEALKREILEETGIILDNIGRPFLNIKHILKDYPLTKENCSVEIYYYYIKTDEPFHLDKLNLDKEEKYGNFKLYYLDINKLKKYLNTRIKDNPVNKIITKEMLLALKEFKKLEKGE